MNASKGTERINDEGAVEVNVETVDYRTPAGRDEPKKEEVEVTHLTRTDGDDQPVTGSVVAEAAGEVAEKLRSAKEAISESTGKEGDKKMQ